MSQPLHHFVAERRAAQHCAELFPRERDPAELAPQWLDLGGRLARALAPRLAALLDGTAPEIEVGADTTPMPGLVAAALIAADGIDGVAHLGIEGAAVLRLVDRAFGGPGEDPRTPPSSFPPSGRLLVERLEAMVLEALSEASAIPVECYAVRLRAQNMAGLPLRAEASAGLTLTVSEAGRQPWLISLSVPQVALPAWLAGVPRRGPTATAAGPMAAPFAEVPLPLTATLVDMRIPLSTAARLAPGLVLPVAVARAVPLAVGGQIIARGSVGHQDDRVALKLNQVA